MQNLLFTKRKVRPVLSGSRGALAVILLITFLFATGAEATGLSGTYTIDASGAGNYITFKGAVTDLTNYGVSGPVVFNVTGVTYSEVVKVGTITGASSTNTIVFRGTGRSGTILTSTGTTVTVSAYTTFDNMNIVSSGTALIKANNSVSCGFTNCNLTGLAGGTGNLISANNSLDFTLYNNEIYGGGYGLNLSGTQASSSYGYLRCTNNRFVNQNYGCIQDQYDFMDSIAFNTFDSSYNTTSGAGNYMDQPLYAYAPNGFIFWGNKIYTNSYDGADIYDPDEYPVSGTNVSSYFVNNWIDIPSTGTNNYQGVNIDLYNGSNFVFAFNSIVDDGAIDEAVSLNFDNSNNITFANNIFYGTALPYDGQLYLYAYSSSFTLYDGNDIYATSSSTSYPLVDFYNGSSFNSYYSYSSYSTALKANNWEINGTNVAPPFVSLNYPDDLHMSTTAAAPKGVPGTGIKTDIDKKGRFPTPTAGASESLYGIVQNNAGVTTLLSPIAQCPGTATVSVVIANLGLNPITSGIIDWSWNGVNETSVSYSSTIPLYGQDSITLGTVSLVSGVNNTLKVWPVKTNSVTNAGGSNDTLNSTVTAALAGGTYTIDPSKAVSASNYKTFTDAAAALSSGVCGAVVFNVVKGTYSEAVTIGSVPGASLANTVTFHGAGRANTTLTSSGVPLTLNSSHYVSFDNMTIATSGSGNVITDGSSIGCHFTSDNLVAPVYSSNSGAVVSSQGSSGLKVNNCRIIGGNYSLYLSTNLDTFTHNRIISSGYTPIYVSGGYGNDFEYNVIDSVSDPSPQFGIQSNGEKGNTWNANAFYFRQASGQPAAVGTGWDCENPNGSSYTPAGSLVPMNWVFTNNIIDIPSATGDAIVFNEFGSNGPVIVAFNTFKCSGGYESEIFMENNNANSNIWASNIMEFDNATYEGIYMYQYSPGFIGAVSQWDNGDTLFDGDDFISSGCPDWVQGSFTANSLASYKSALNPSGYERNASSVVPNFLNSGANPLYLDTTKAGPAGVNVCVPVSNSFINFAGVTTDITGRKRCALFPTAGAYEDPFGKAPIATKIFVPASGIYPNSPATIYQSHVTGSPAIYVWSIKNSNFSSWTPISTSVDLYYSGWTTGTDSLKLVTTSCTGMDSAIIGLSVSAPTSVPKTDFIASANTIQQNTSVQFTDLSTNGPTQWNWQITPDSITVGSIKLPTTTQYNNSLNNTQNPSIQFLYPGFYEVCLTAYNGLGKGITDCKPNYIQVVPATNLSDTAQTITSSTGYIYDNGGPDGNYSAVGAPYIESILIQPCADSIYLTFSQFDTKCGSDFVRLYNGSIPVSSALIGPCNTNIGTNGEGPGFNGGPTNTGCTSYCIPNVNKPDTFRAGKTMLVNMVCYTGNAPGFAAYYWTKPSTDKKVMPSFNTASGSDSVCAGQLVTFVNTTTINPADPPSFEWDLDGSIADGFECVGACATAQWPYFLPEAVPVTLIAINCGGADTIIKSITVISPPKPVPAFSANNLEPTTSDVVTFTSTTAQCVDDYKWTITASSGTAGGASAVFVNNTTRISPSPQVTFPDTGYYDVKLYVDNASATQSDSVTKIKYIHVRNPYCTPSVALLSQGVGINHVVFNTIDNYTTPQASSAYLDFTDDASMSTNIAIGASYNLSVSRDPNSIYSPINRDAWIDWKQDGSFTDAGDNVLKDSNSTSETYTAKVTVPKTAKLGATVMRIAVNLYLYPNVPCGPNQFGEFQDYRIYVTPYDILPVITLKGIHTLEDTIKIEQGRPFIDPGDSGSSYLYGNITKNIIVTSKIVGGSAPFNALIPGVYVFTYNLKDSAGNNAVPQYRVVKVFPQITPPDLIVNAPDTIYLEVRKTPFSPSILTILPTVKSDFDIVDGNLAGSVYIDTTLVQTTVVGVYPVTYTSTDLDGLTSRVKRYVDVIDTIKPVLTINGADPDTVQVYTPYVDPGVRITIPNGYFLPAQLIPRLRITNTVNDSVVGTYKVTYNLTDSFGNVAIPVVRTVVVADKIAPVLTLVGPPKDSILVFNTYFDPGYTVSDNYTKTSAIKVTVSGTFVTAFKSNYANKLGGGRDSLNPGVGPLYRLTYTATDLSGNKSSVTRYIEVYDNIPPVIALVGQPVITICRWSQYLDPGYTVSDYYSDSANIKVVTKTNFITSGGTSLPQELYYTYVATDQAGNSASVTRYIYVLNNDADQCSSGIEPGLGLDKYVKIFPNPSSGIVNVEVNLPTTQNVHMYLMNTLGQQVLVVHDGTLLNNDFRLDLSNSASGVYFLNIVTNNQILTKRIEITN